MADSIEFWRAGEWTMVYLNGELVTHGDHHHADEWLQEHCGVVTIDDDDNASVPDGHHPVHLCLVNNKQDLGIFNGQQFEVAEVRDGAMLLRDDDGAERWFDYFPEGFQGLAGEKEMKDKRRAWRGGVGAFTFAQVITCHKAQGSEWDSVYVVDQTAQMWKSTAEEKRRWCYTAVSRASVSVTVAAVRT